MFCKEVFAARLKWLRQRKNISLAALAKEIGITPQSLSLYENAERVPNIEVLYKLARYFNVSSDYLIGLSDCPDTKGCKDTGVCKCMASRMEKQLQNTRLFTMDADGDIVGGGMSLSDMLPSSFFEVD